MKKHFNIFECLGLLSLLLTGCGGGGGSTEPLSESPTHEHTWAEPTYTWSVDYSSCTAERVCTQDSTHKESETVNSSYAVVTPATEEEEGLGRYTATFTKTAFVTQTQDIVLDKLEPSYYGETPILSEDGKTLTYGLYPQTNVNDSDLISELDALTNPESNGWYLYDNGYYAKVSATPYHSNCKFDNGTTIEEGTTYWFKCEPITWNVLSNNNGEYYILSSVLLDVHRYNEDYEGTKDGYYANNYEYSEIRSWLNNEFYNSAFALGNTYIQTTTVDNSATTTDSSSNPYACNNTQDKVFLPSFNDYINPNYGFSTLTSSTDTRYCKTTDWARARAAEYDYTDSRSYQYSSYWSRSPHSNICRTWFIRRDGRFGFGDVGFLVVCVRPALTVKIA